MKVNEHTAISTTGVLLVPYDRRHVPTYHAWMEDEAVRTATASDRLTLEEEYANQVSWRADADKLTFIVCQPLGPEDRSEVLAGVDDVPDRMVGDINFFVTPWVSDDADDADDADDEPRYSGEVDVMIAHTTHRGVGLGRAAVTAFLYYILARQQTAILAEATGDRRAARLQQLVVKIQATNAASIGLFTSLGFCQRGSVNYFGEIELVRTDWGGLVDQAPPGYVELPYARADCN